jgi:protein SCO1/2/putative membrane protein
MAPDVRRRVRPLAGLLLALLAVGTCPAADEDQADLGRVGAFSLTERDGRTVTRDDLRGKVWVASFVFTRCTGGCPQIAATLRQLQDAFAGYPNVLLVTFTVDPEHDNPAELRRYAEIYEADPHRWLFLTGSEKQLHDVIRNSFHLHAEPTYGADRRPGNEFSHDTRLVVVDADGTIRGYFDGLRDTRWPDPEKHFQTDQKKLRRLVNHLAFRPPSYLPQDLPRLNATLNAVSAFLLILGFVFIKTRHARLHISCMLTALAVSALFLTSYLYYHLAVKGGRPTRFQDEAIGAPDSMRYLYLGILGTHTLLAVVVAPLALYVAYQGLRGRFKRHVRVARWTLPVWLYVSVTGVVVYWMLYRLYPGA